MWVFHGRSNSNKQEHILFAPFRNDAEKERLLSTIKLYTVIHEIDEYVIASEAWMRTAVDPNERNLGKVSEHPDRQECLILLHVKREGERRLSQGRFYYMRRDDKGNLTKLEPLREGMGVGGDMTELIPPVTPPKEVRAKVQEIWDLGRRLNHIPDLKPILHSIKGGKDPTFH